MNFYKDMAYYCDFDIIDKFALTTFEDIQVGDIIMTQTTTYSQKYFDVPGYEDFNMTKIGILLEKNLQEPAKSIIYKYNKDKDDFEETNIYTDPMNSGYFLIYKI